MKSWGGEFSSIVGTCTVREAHSLLGGLGACPPRKILKIKCYKIESGGNSSLSQ